MRNHSPVWARRYQNTSRRWLPTRELVAHAAERKTQRNAGRGVRRGTRTDRWLRFTMDAAPAMFRRCTPVRKCIGNSVGRMLRPGPKLTIHVADERRNPFGVLFVSVPPSQGSRGWRRDNPGLADGTALPYVTGPKGRDAHRATVTTSGSEVDASFLSEGCQDLNKDT